MVKLYDRIAELAPNSGVKVLYDFYYEDNGTLPKRFRAPSLAILKVHQQRVARALLLKAGFEEFGTFYGNSGNQLSLLGIGFKPTKARPKVKPVQLTAKAFAGCCGAYVWHPSKAKYAYTATNRLVVFVGTHPPAEGFVPVRAFNINGKTKYLFAQGLATN